MISTNLTPAELPNGSRAPTESGLRTSLLGPFLLRRVVEISECLCVEFCGVVLLGSVPRQTPPNPEEKQC